MNQRKAVKSLQYADFQNLILSSIFPVIAQCAIWVYRVVNKGFRHKMGLRLPGFDHPMHPNGALCNSSWKLLKLNKSNH